MFGPEARLPKKKSELARTACENAAVTWRWCPHCGLKISATSVVSSRQAAHTRLVDYGYQSRVWDLVFFFLGGRTGFRDMVRDVGSGPSSGKKTTRDDNSDDNEDDNSERQ